MSDFKEYKPLEEEYNLDNCRRRKIMQIVIDVDEKLVCEGFERPFTEEEKSILIRAIGNGRSYNPTGECKTCVHRDPEDKKCDCGALERAGCPFPVSDDYFCKFYKKGE